MRFVSAREFRGNLAEVWRRLAEEHDIVITSNGKPVAILSAVSPDDLEESLAALRRRGRSWPWRPCSSSPWLPGGIAWLPRMSPKKSLLPVKAPGDWGHTVAVGGGDVA